MLIKRTQFKKFLSFLLILFAVSFCDPVHAQYWTDDWLRGGDIAFDSFGWSMADVGDVNGDGYHDFAVGCPDHGDPFPVEEEEGKIYLFYGSPSGLSLVPGWTYEPDDYLNITGFDVGGGDLNGDGYSDIVAGCIQWEGSFANEGRAIFFYGGPFGPGSVPDWEFHGDQTGALMGSSCTIEGDVNSDGYNDMFIAAKQYSNPEPEEGKVWMFSGSPSGPVGPVWSYEPNQEHAITGFPTSYAGDVNADGYDDIVIGVNMYDSVLVGDGLVVGFYGSATGLATEPDWHVTGPESKTYFGHWTDGAGDVNGDGYDDVLISAILMETDETEHDEGFVYCYYGSASGLSNDPVWHTEGGQLGANYGYCVAGAGDVNKDGYADVVIGAKYYANPEIDEGAGYLFFGSPDGLETNYCWMTEGNADSAYCGRHVESGDFNDDGYSDFAVSCYRADFDGVESAGKIEMHYGKPRESDWHFSNDSVCISDVNPVPHVDGLSGGVFTGSAGVVFVSTLTGEVNLTATGAGVYEISYTYEGEFCAATVTHTLTIGLAADAAFSYDSLSYVNSPFADDPYPVIGAGSSAGEFYAVPAGLAFVSTSTGQIDLSESLPGTYWVYNKYAVGCVAIDSFQLTIIEYTDGVNDIQDLSAISIYPNPTNSKLTLHFEDFAPAENVEVQIFHNDGVAVYEEKVRLPLTGDFTKQISVRNFSEGIYHIVFTSRGKVIHRTFVKVD